MMKGCTGLGKRVNRLARLARVNGGRVAYYGAVAAALCAIAIAAGQYGREGADGSSGEALMLPAADLSAAMEQLSEDANMITDMGTEIDMPDGAQVLRSFSAVPQWNGELGQWEVHTGADVAFAGDAVCCLMDGEVVGLGRSGAWGGFAELKCGERLFRYASIEPAENIQIGMQLAAGESVGRADGSMPGEAGMERHVHLEVWEGEEAVDFESLTAKIHDGD